MLKAKPTPQHSLEHALADTRQAFEDFTYIVAHDLNAPLRCIVNFSQLLEDKCRTSLDEKAVHYIELITENSRKAQARLAGLLQYSRLDTVPMELRAIDCRESLDQCLNQLKDDIEERSAEINIGALPKIIADGNRLTLLWYCLLSNALKFNEGRPVIDIGATRGHDEAWVFSVRDNGIGLSPGDQERIFDVFHRLHRDEEYPGTGMGLALARRIVELHGGLIWVESVLQKGSGFYFTIPGRMP